MRLSADIIHMFISGNDVEMVHSCPISQSSRGVSVGVALGREMGPRFAYLPYYVARPSASKLRFRLW